MIPYAGISEEMISYSWNLGADMVLSAKRTEPQEKPMGNRRLIEASVQKYGAKQLVDTFEVTAKECMVIGRDPDDIERTRANLDLLREELYRRLPT
jgi:hypothetical protein